MEKRTLKFQCLITLARFSRTVSVGYLMNTNNLTLTGKFDEADIKNAALDFGAKEIATTEKVYSYEW